MIRACLAVAAGLGPGLLIGGWPGIVVGLLSAALIWHRLGRVEPGRSREERRRAEADLPFAIDLLASALRAGLPVQRAVQVVAEEVGGPVSIRMRRVSNAMALGLGTNQAWSAFGDLSVGRRLTTAVDRSSASGAALAGAMFRLAEELRTTHTAAAEAAGRRAGVLIVLPLGLCFLPAFIFAGIVPVIIAVVGDVLRP